MTNQFDDYDPNVFLGGRSSIREPLAPIGGNFLRDLQTFWRGINRNTFEESEARRRAEAQRASGVAGKPGAPNLLQRIVGSEPVQRILGEGLQTLGPRAPARLPTKSVLPRINVPEGTPTVNFPDPIAAPSTISRSANENIHPNFRTDEMQYLRAVDRQSNARDRLTNHPFEIIEGGPNARPSLHQRALEQFNNIRRQAGEPPITMEEYLQNQRFYDSEIPGTGPKGPGGGRRGPPQQPQQPSRQAYVRESFNPPVASNLSGPQASTLNRVSEWLRNSNIGYQMHADSVGTVYIHSRHPTTGEVVRIRVPKDGHFGFVDESFLSRTGGQGNYFDTGHRIRRDASPEQREFTRNVSGEQYAIPEVLEQALTHRFTASPSGQFLTSPGTEPVYGQPTGSVPLTGHTIWPRGRGPNMSVPRPERITLGPRQLNLPDLTGGRGTGLTKGPGGNLSGRQQIAHAQGLNNELTALSNLREQTEQRLMRLVSGLSINNITPEVSNAVRLYRQTMADIDARVQNLQSQYPIAFGQHNVRGYIDSIRQSRLPDQQNLPGMPRHTSDSPELFGHSRFPGRNAPLKGPRDDINVGPNRVTADQIVDWLNRSNVPSQITTHRGGTQYISAINPHSRNQDSVIIRVSPEGHIGRGPERRSHEVGRRFDTGHRLAQPHHREDTRITRNVGGESYADPQTLFDALRHRLSVDPEGQFLTSPGREPVYRQRNPVPNVESMGNSNQLRLDLNVSTGQPRRGWSGRVPSNTKGIIDRLRPETVRESVVRIGNRDFSGRTHAEALMQAEKELGARFESALGTAESLFRTNRGNVISREDAMRLMQRSNSRFNEVHNRLTSEDLIDLDPNY